MTTDTRNIDMDKIIRKLRSLAAMTVENGCSEEEAANAMNLMHEMMDTYNVQSFQGGRFDHKIAVSAIPGFISPKGRQPECSPCLIPLTKMTQTRAFFIDKDLHIIGTEANRMYAQTLLVIIQSALLTEYARFQNSPRYPLNVHGNIIRHSFMFGMNQRLRQRIMAMYEASKASSVASTGTDLVVAAEHDVDAAADKIGLNKPGKEVAVGRTRKPRHARSMEAGFDAGNNVNLNTSIDKDRSKKLSTSV